MVLILHTHTVAMAATTAVFVAAAYPAAAADTDAAVAAAVCQCGGRCWWGCSRLRYGILALGHGNPSRRPTTSTTAVATIFSGSFTAVNERSAAALSPSRFREGPSTEEYGESLAVLARRVPIAVGGGGRADRPELKSDVVVRGDGVVVIGPRPASTRCPALLARRTERWNAIPVDVAVVVGSAAAAAAERK